MTDEINQKVLGLDDSMPTPTQAWTAMRGTSFGEPMVQPLGSKLYGYAKEGSYFVATNPTMGTGIAGIAASTSYDAAEHLLFLRNVSSTKLLYLDFIEITVTAAGANGTTTGFTMVGDKGTSRRGTGGSTITPVSANMDKGSSADVTMAFGALATGAASADVRPFGDFLVRSVIKVVGDTYRFTFGDSCAAWTICGADLAGTAVTKVTIPCPPVILGENDQFLLSDWGASQSGASSYQFRCGFWLR